VPPARPAIAREPTSLTVADRAHRRRAPGCGRCHIWRNPTTSRSLYRGVSPALPSRRVPARPRKQGPHPRASGHLLLATSGPARRSQTPAACRGPARARVRTVGRELAASQGKMDVRVLMRSAYVDARIGRSRGPPCIRRPTGPALRWPRPLPRSDSRVPTPASLAAQTRESTAEVGCPRDDRSRSR
jgi:hypothetical protein